MPREFKPDIEVVLRWPPTVPETEYNRDFLQGMLNRVAMGYQKYGPKEKVDTQWVESIEMRIEKYRQTGNTEWLIDIANYAMLEFMQPRHPNAHFRATDSHESPGHMSGLGERTKGSNIRPETRYRHEGD